MRKPSHPGALFKRRRWSTLLEPDDGKELLFPEGFLWGAATASHQADGMDTASDWWRFERTPGKVQNFDNFPEFARDCKSDHWRRFPEDVARMRDELGLSAYRFSLDWSRIEPEEGRFDEAVLGRYAELCSLMREKGIAPFVTLFHWSSPDWIWEMGREESSGWCSERIVDRFGRYVEKVAGALAPHVDLWCTLNEPNVFLYGGFSEGILAPGLTLSDDDLLPILINLFKCHAKAFEIINEHDSKAKIGFAHNCIPFEPSSNRNPLEGLAAAVGENAYTWTFPDGVARGRFTFTTRRFKRYREEIKGLAGTADWLGVNYYERELVRIPRWVDLRRTEVLFDPRDLREIWPPLNDPGGFLYILKKAWKRYGLPIYVTENGRAHRDDAERIAYLRSHLRALARAMGEHGVDARGYFWWSLLDNQEWANGFVPRFGLYEVDYSNGERRLRESGRAYAGIIRRGRI